MCSTENDRRFYVYVHRDAADRVFYVGKGTGDRAWSKSRDELWHRYVTERSGGKYSVEIVSDGLNEEEALELEEELIERYGDACTNWVNVRRKFDFEACERYWKLRKEAQRLTAEAAQLPPERREEAIALCHKALALVDEYDSLTLETGLIPELHQDPKVGDVNVLHRLWQLHKRAMSLSDFVPVAQAYFDKYPAARALGKGRPISVFLESLPKA